MARALHFANYALLVLYPVAWFAPLMRAGLLPLFGLSEISVVSGLQALWETDAVLALIVTVFAISYATFWAIKKTVGLRVTEAEEDAGLDISEHGMYGYPEVFIPQPEYSTGLPGSGIGAPTPAPAATQMTATDTP